MLYLGLRLPWPGADASPAAGDLLGLSELRPESVEGVTIAKPEDTVRLSRSGGTWTVGRWPADSARIEALWRAVEEAKAAELVARSPANHPRLGVTDSAATRVTFFSGGDRRSDFLLGQSGPSWQSAYVRRPGEPEVYLLRGELASLLRRGRDEWRSREIARFDPVRADRVIVLVDDDSVTLERRDTTWTVAAGSGGPVPADSAAVRRAVESLSRLSSAGFVADSVVETLRFDRPSARVRALDASGSVLADLLFITGEDEGSYYVKRADRPDVWSLSRFSVGDFLRGAKEFQAASGS